MISIRSHCALLLMAVVLLFSSCEPATGKLDITIKTDYSELVAKIENANLSLLERMSLLQKAMESGLADNQAAIELIQQAVESMSGSLNDKLAALEEAVKSQTITLETKLAIIEAAMNTGFADEKAAQKLLKEAVESLGGTMETKLAAIDSTLASQQATLSAKLALIETAIKEGFAGEKTRQELIQQTLEALGGSLEEKLKAIEETMKSQSSGLDTKLELIQKALTNGFTDDKTALNLISTAVASLKEVVNGMDQDIDAIVATLGTLDPATGTVSAALTSLLEDVSGMSDYPTILASIEQAVSELAIVVKYRGHGYVDLGNGLKWATCNVGASRPEEYGDYFAWGETSTKASYDETNYFYYKNSEYTKYTAIDSKTMLGPEDDAARVKWDGTWRMPTGAEFSWLLDSKNCTWEWTNNYRETGVKGVIVKSVVPGYEGNQIFFPAAGLQSLGNKQNVGTLGSYWSASLDSSHKEQAKLLQFNNSESGSFELGSYSRFSGLSIRPVSD